MHSDLEIDQILAEQRRQRNRQRLLRRLGILAAVILAIVVLAFATEPYLRRARNSGNEASAIGSLRAISSAQAVFSTTCGGYYATRLTQLGRPGVGGFAPLSADLAMTDRIEKARYQMWIDAEPTADAPECNGLPAGQVSRSFVIRAEPVPGGSERFFALSSDSTDVYEARAPVRFSKGIVTGGAKPVTP
jgi:hypothetical protein